MLFGLVAAVVLAHGSIVKAVAMIILGLLIGLAGTDTQSGVARFTFGVPELYDGVDFVPVAMGLFGFAEIMSNLDRRGDQPTTTAPISSLWPNREEIRRAIPAILRGTSIGSFLGILPGGGAVLASFAAYTLEKKVSRYANEFGKGAVEGVAGPESANNAGAQTSFIPLLTLGIPSTPVMALMMGAMTIQGIAPGTAIITERPLLFWGMIASMWIGNLMLVIINLPLIGIWVTLLKVPYRILFPIHPRVLLRGRVQHQQQHVPDHDDGRIRAARLRVSQARLRGRAVPARLCAGTAHGGKSAPLDGAVVRRSVDLRDAPDLARDPAADARPAGADRGATIPPDPHGGVSGGDVGCRRRGPTLPLVGGSRAKRAGRC